MYQVKLLPGCKIIPTAYLNALLRPDLNDSDVDTVVFSRDQRLIRVVTSFKFIATICFLQLNGL